MFKHLDHVAFAVKDRENSIQFYEEHFGFQKYAENDVPVPIIEKMEPPPAVAREPREEGWRRVVLIGPDGEQIEIRG